MIPVITWNEIKSYRNSKDRLWRLYQKAGKPDKSKSPHLLALHQNRKAKHHPRQLGF